MARFSTLVQAVAVVAATPKTILQLVAGSTKRLKVEEIWVSFNGVTASDAPAVVELVRQTSAGTSSAGTVYLEDEASEAVLASSRITVTAEPTDGGLIPRAFYLTPNGGFFVYQLPEGKEIVIATSGRLGIRVTPTANVSCSAGFVFRE